MKYALLLLSAVLVFTACKKKTERKNCYVCTANDSVWSNQDSLINPHHDIPSGGDKPHSGTRCQFTDAMKNYYLKQSTFTDTLKLTKHDPVNGLAQNGADTIEIEFWTMKCELY